MPNVKRAGDLLTELFREYDPQTLETARITAGLLSSWEIAAGEARVPAASAHSRIRDFDRGVLLIEAEHPGWIQLLQTKQNQILNSYQKKYPELDIQGISFCLSKTPISRPPAPGENTAQAENAHPPAEDPPNEAGNEKDRALHESIKKLEKVLRKRNKNLPEP